MISPSLRGRLLLALLSMLVTLIISYTLIASAYFRTGIDTLTKAIMRDLHAHYAHQVDLQQPIEQPELLGFSVLTRFSDLPDFVQQSVDVGRLVQDQLLVVRRSSNDPVFPGMIFLMRMSTPQGHDLYHLRLVRPGEFTDETARDIHHSMQQLLMIGAVALILSLAILVLLYRSVTGPLQHLVRWAGRLGPAGLEQPRPNFRYSELDSLAELMQQSLHASRQALIREHDFLRHASHELRTPLTIISTNLQLLEQFQPPQDPLSCQVMTRISRATHQMSQMTETLLWLSRDEEYLPTPQPVAVDALIRELVDTHSHLFDGKALVVEIDLPPYTLRLPAVPCRIVLSNLIRNACQHTQAGTIRMRLGSDGELSIHNDLPQPDATPAQADSFGFGLELVRQLCERFHWPFVHEQKPGRWGVRLQLTESSAVGCGSAQEPLPRG